MDIHLAKWLVYISIINCEYINKGAMPRAEMCAGKLNFSLYPSKFTASKAFLGTEI